MFLPIIQRECNKFCCSHTDTLIVLSLIYTVSINDKVKFKEAATGGFLYKKLFLKILKYSQENTCVGGFLKIKLQALQNL